MHDLHIESKTWVKSTNSLLGQGRIELKKNTDKDGSISKAAKVMNMSYKKAWGLVSYTAVSSRPMHC